MKVSDFLKLGLVIALGMLTATGLLFAAVIAYRTVDPGFSITGNPKLFVIFITSLFGGLLGAPWYLLIFGKDGRKRGL